jgi:hypothetical protein
LFLFSPNKKKKEHQSELNSATSWTPNLWKVPYDTPFLPISQFQSCLCESEEQTTYYTNCTQPQPLQCLTQAHSTATEITHTRATKPSSPISLPLPTHPFSCSSF